MSLYPFADTMTETVCDRFVRAARIRRPLRQLAWRNAVQDAINNLSKSGSVIGAACDAKTPPGLLNNFRPANPAKSADVSCVVSAADAAARVERQGGATSASALADSAVGARRLTPG